MEKFDSMVQNLQPQRTKGCRPRNIFDAHADRPPSFEPSWPAWHWRWARRAPPSRKRPAWTRPWDSVRTSVCLTRGNWPGNPLGPMHEKPWHFGGLTISWKSKNSGFGPPLVQPHGGPPRWPTGFLQVRNGCPRCSSTRLHAATCPVAALKCQTAFGPPWVPPTRLRPS